MYSFDNVQYAFAVSSHMPMRVVRADQSSTYLCTESRHRWLNAAMPYSSICCFPEKPSSFSISSSTGRP
jgi:hypothetical protein